MILFVSFFFFFFLPTSIMLTLVAGVVESRLFLYYFFFLSFLNLFLLKEESWVEVDIGALALDLSLQ